MLTQYKWLSAGLIPFVLAGAKIRAGAPATSLVRQARCIFTSRRRMRGISPERSVRTEDAVSTIVKDNNLRI
jgi:hypothetical protein